MKRFFQFRLRTLLALVTLIAISFALGPRAWHRYRVNRAFASALESGPGELWSSFPFETPSREDMLLLLSDQENISNRLFAVLTNDSETIAHQQQAISTLVLLYRGSGSAELRSTYLRKLIQLAIRLSRDDGRTERVLLILKEWIPGTGISAGERDQLFATAKREPLTPGWAGVLIAIGGRREITYVLPHGGTHDPQLLDAIHNSKLAGSLWPGLLPYLRAWLKDPIVADAGITRYAILTLRPQGRQILLDCALDDALPLTLRTQAVETLQENVAGIDLLTEASRHAVVRSKLSKLLGGAPSSVLATTKKSLRKDYVDDFWLNLINGLSPDYWTNSSLSGNYPPEIKLRLEAQEKQLAALNLKVLQRLAGRDDLKTMEEWKQWLTTAAPKPPTDVEIVTAVIDDPELLSSGPVLHRFFPAELGGLPADCLPLDKQLLHRGNNQQKCWAAYALLKLTDDLEAVPVVIELLSLSKPSGAASREWMELSLLRDHFAENFFWDVDTWRKWWQVYEPNPNSETDAAR